MVDTGDKYMQVSIRNKWVSLGGSSTVKDMDEKDVLFVKGRIFSFTRKKFVQDLSGNTLFVVRNKFWRLFQRKAFVEKPDKTKVAMVRRKIFSLHDHYYVTSDLGDLQIRGNILQYDYHITLNGQEIGHISRMISLRDSFVLDLDDKYDLPTFVSLVIAIDLIVDRQRRDQSSSMSDNSDMN
jgi:uncharacterized protein YxjI